MPESERFGSGVTGRKQGDSAALRSHQSGGRAGGGRADDWILSAHEIKVLTKLARANNGPGAKCGPPVFFYVARYGGRNSIKSQ